MRIVLTGASGFLAGEIIPDLLAAGHKLTLVSRTPERLRENFPECEVAHLNDWNFKSAGADLLIHLAALNNDAPSTREEFVKANVKLTGRLSSEARSAGISRFIYVSTVQTVLPRSNSWYALSKLEGGKIARYLFGPGCEVILLGNVHGRKFCGRVRFLNHLPRRLASRVFSLISALRPTTHTSLILNYVENPLPENSSYGHILTDVMSRKLGYRIWEKCLDYFFVLMVVLISPVVLVSCGAVLVSTGWPVLFAQKRLGRRERPFVLLKIRTMVKSAIETASHLSPVGEITAIGRFLRKSKIDELPQAINILRSDMNLVGPRPCLVTQADVISERRSLGVFGLKPGLTGWAQVNSIDMSDPKRLALLDSEYMHLRSVLFDIRVLNMTIARSLFGKAGNYNEGGSA